MRLLTHFVKIMSALQAVVIERFVTESDAVNLLQEPLGPLFNVIVCYF